MCARFLSHLLLLYSGRLHGAMSGCTVLWEMHPASAQTKSLISDTAYICTTYLLLDVFQKQRVLDKPTPWDVEE